MAEGRRRRDRPSRTGGALDRDHDDERGLRGIVGTGPSQVGVSGALRARDAARPTAADLAAAEHSVQLIRRNYVPPPSGSSGSTRERS